MTDLVYIDEYGLKGSNFYWRKHAAHGLTKEDIIGVGVTSDRVPIDKTLVEPLLAINKELEHRGWELYIKEGYRSKELYEIVYKRRIEKYGEKETAGIFNMTKMPHASGRAVDIAIWDKETNKEIYLRDSKDGAPALFLNFYKGKDDVESKKYQELQEFLVKIMQSCGFHLGTKNEYFHFELD
jgi:D-alanyl-D-alanine dipeptidase